MRKIVLAIMMMNAGWTSAQELDDVATETIKKLERPQVFIENGQPIHAFFACRNEVQRYMPG